MEREREKKGCKVIRMKKRGIVLFFIFMLLMSGCDKESYDISDAEETTVEKDIVNEAVDESDYVEDDTENQISEICNFCIIDDLDVHSIRAKDVAGERIFVSIVNADPDQEFLFTSYTNRQYDLKGNVITEYTREFKDNYVPHYAEIDEDGIIYSVMDYNTVDGPSFSADKKGVFLCASTAEGEELWSYYLKKEQDDEEYCIKDMEITKNGDIALLSTNGIELLNRDGSYEGAISLENQQGQKLVSIQNGNVVVIFHSHYNEDGSASYLAHEVNLDKGVMEAEAIEFPINITNSNCNSDLDYDMILSDERFLYGFDIKSGQFDILIDYLISNMDSVNASNLDYFPDGSVFVMDEISIDSNELYGKIYY